MINNNNNNNNNNNCDISWWNPCTLVRDSSCVPLMVVLSLVHQTDDLALNLPKIKVKKELHKVVPLKTFSKFDKKFSNSKLSWLEDLYATQK